MNKVILMGRLTRDPEVRYSAGENGTAFARFTVAVDRRFRRDNEATADFIPCVAFGKQAEFVEKYFRQGARITLAGRIQTGSYTNRDGQKVYTTDVIVEEVEFAESKNSSGSYEGGRSAAQPSSPGRPAPSNAVNNNRPVGDGFINIPDGIDEELPFN